MILRLHVTIETPPESGKSVLGPDWSILLDRLTTQHLLLHLNGNCDSLYSLYIKRVNELVPIKTSVVPGI